MISAKIFHCCFASTTAWMIINLFSFIAGVEVIDVHADKLYELIMIIINS